MKYRKRPFVIEAMQWTGDNANELSAWSSGDFSEIHPDDRADNPAATGQVFVNANRIYAPVEPREWIIRDELGHYPCKPDVFAKTYEQVED